MRPPIAHRIAALLVAVVLLPAAVHAAEPLTAAVFEFDLIDTSLEGEIQGTPQADLDRLARAGEQLRAALAASSRFVVIDTGPVEARAERRRPLYRCNGCEATLAAEIGADLAFVGWVQKVSNLILNINVTIRDARTRAMLHGASVDVRGNTDKSWRRGLDYLIRNNLKIE